MPRSTQLLNNCSYHVGDRARTPGRIAGIAMLFSIALAAAIAMPAGSSDRARGGQCMPSSTGQVCLTKECPSADERCAPRCVFVDAAAGSYFIEDCDCRGPGACAVNLVNANGVSGCVKIDNGAGTVDEPTIGCVIRSPNELFLISNGLPAGSTIQIDGSLDTYINTLEAIGGDLGGHVQTFEALFHMPMTGTGALAGFNRNIFMQVDGEFHTAPRTPGEPIQSFDTKVEKIQGQLIGDPDFTVLRLRIGNGLGLPSPGHTTLTKLPSGDFAVDSFFDMTYQLEFVGAPGSVLSGFAGTTTGTVRMRMGQTIPSCVGSCPNAAPCRANITDIGNNTFNICCDCPSCPADLTDPQGGPPDGVVNVFDLFVLLSNWNMNGPGADLAPANNIVDVFDLFVLLGAWGNCP